MVRCINLDWLEVHAMEADDGPRDAAYFVRNGFVVHQREYGTRVYREMFTLDGFDGLPLLEVRRNPKSQGVVGIHDARECHIRLVNRTCYFDDAAAQLRTFLDAHGYTFMRISRVDICLDFSKFDEGDDPQVFIARYLRRKYSKINQGNIHCHGADTWSGQKFNSLSWGSPASDIGTKLYDKTLELYDPASGAYRKPYIRYAWLKAGLIDDYNTCTLKGEVPTIWRLEFSIRSSVKKWFAIELNGHRKAKQSIHNTLDLYDSRDKLLLLFASLTQHYFHFKYFREDTRKDRCPDKVLFHWDDMQFVYKVGREASLIGDGKKSVYYHYEALIRKLRLFQATHNHDTIRKACRTLIEVMQGESMRADSSHIWSREEITALQLAVGHKQRNPSAEIAVILQEIKKLLKINDNTAPFI